MTTFICINCKDNHKFSPFNVTNESYSVLPNAFPLLIIDDKTKKFKVIIEKEISKKTYDKLTKELIQINKLNSNSVLYWTDGIKMFDNQGLIKLLVSNNNLISNDTIESLIKTIYCPLWWDDLLYEFASISQDTITNNIKRAEDYHKIIIEKATELNKQIKDYLFPKLFRIIRSLHEKQKRENEAALQKLQEQRRIMKEKLIKEKLIKDQEQLLARQAKELLDDSDLIFDTRTPEEIFKENLKSNTKGSSYKFLAAINPESTIIADLVMKSGEKSQLQIGVNNETNIKKIKLWEYWLRQEEDIRNGIKYAKPTWTKKDTKLDDNSIPDLPLEPKKDKPRILLNLTKIQQLQYATIMKNSKLVSKEQSSFKLDEWQTIAIETIQQFKSCLITGPTSGGKTYVMMKGLDNIINSNVETNLAYISPTFHLAYQTYANIKATFPTRNVAIITSEIINIPLNANIFIGTASELLNYFITTNKKFHIGIFDEIHVASKIYIDTYNKSDVIRANAYANLLSRCLTQVIAASATITNDIDMIKFICSQMNKFKSTEDKKQIETIKLIKYTTRIIPLLEYNYIMNERIEPLTREQTEQIDQTENNDKLRSDITPKNLFLLLCRMRERDMLPGIIFDISDDIAWKSYVELINYTEMMEQLEYNSYNELIDKINSIIENFNTDRDKRLDTMPAEDILDSTKIKKNTANNKRESGLRAISSQHFKTHQNLVSQSKNIFERSIIKFNTEPWESLCIIPKDKISSNILRMITKACSCSKEDLFEKFPDFKITQVHVDMLAIMKSIEDIEPDQSEAFVRINTDKGSFYRFSNSSCGMDQLKAIREPGSDENNWKLRKRMIILANAQSIMAKDIDGIIDVIMRGLEFGITIINRSLPFVIQNIILDNLRTKNMGIVFASESMSMGINYALRSVIIKSPKDLIKINPCKLIQMGGRCGRRGKDDQAHVIYWGIQNSNEANTEFIEPIQFPDHFILNDQIETDTKENLAIKLGAIFQTLYFKEEKTKSEDLKKHEKKMNHIKKHDKVVEIVIVDDEEIRIKKRSIDIKLNRLQYLDPTIRILCIYLKYTDTETEFIVNLICKIDSDIILDSFSVDSYMKSRDINLLMHVIIELHNTYAMSTNTEFLNYLEKIVNILQTCEYRLIKLAK